MVNTSVKDVSTGMQLFDLGKANAGKKAQTGNDLFQDVLNKEAGQNVPNENKQTVKTKPEQAKDFHQNQNVRTDKVKKSAETPEENELTEDELVRAQEVLNEEATTILQTIAETFGVSEEELNGMLEELDLEVTDLLDADKLGALLLKAAGETDSFSLITNEELYGKFQDVMKLRQNISDEIQKETGIEPKDLLKAMDEIPEERSTESDKNVSQDILIVNDGLNEKAAVKTDANQGNNRESGNDKSDAKTEDAGIGFTDNLKQADGSFEVTEVSETSETSETDTQNIMRQIMDFMKISVRPESNHLMMQLHPASLGSLQIQLASKGGAVTAQFIAQNETVKAVLESQMITLKENFEQQGLKVEAIEVTVQTHQFEENMNQSREQAEEAQAKKARPRRIRLDGVEGEELLEEADDEIRIAQEMLKANGNQVDYTA